MINNLDSYGSALLFADDRTLVTMSGDPVEAAFHAQHHFGSSRPKAWFSANKLKLNKEKPQRLLSTLSRIKPSGSSDQTQTWFHGSCLGKITSKP